MRYFRMNPWFYWILITCTTGVVPVLAVDLVCSDGPSEPCGIRYSVSFLSDEGPLSEEQREHYCQTMRETGRRIWIMTDGKHYLDRVEFVWDSLSADTTWHREHGSIYHDWISGKIRMSDSFIGCTTRGDAGCIEDQQLWDLPAGDLLCNLEAELPNPNTGQMTVYKFCSYDGGTEYPADAVPAPWDEKGATMTHEIGHQFYDLRDEYTYPGNPQGWPWSIRVCDNEEDGVCVMARIQRPHMCDNGYDYDDPGQAIFWSHVSNTCEPHFTGDSQYCGGDYPDGVTCDDDAETCNWESTSQAKQHSCWASARNAHIDLDNAHEQTGVYPSEAMLGDPPKVTECQWSEGFEQHQVMLLDRSGSMNYVGPSQVKAIKEAADAALYFFNHGTEDKENGVLGFNDSFEWLKDFGTFSESDQSSEWDPPFDNSNGGVTAGGSTDICGAIIEMTDRVRAVHPSKQYGQDEARDVVHAVLLSDGRQTVEYLDTPCFPDAAARVACTPEQDWGYPAPYPMPDPQAPRIRIHTLAYGDYDPAALYDISSECGGTVWAAGQTTENQNLQQPDPHELKTYIARSATLTRDYDELLDTHELIDPGGIESKIFSVPAESLALEFSWLGSRYWAESDGVKCGFQRLKDFELLSPSGIVHTTPAVDPDLLEGWHWAKSLRVPYPEPGTWTARFDSSGLGCPVQHKLDVAWLASVENPSLLAAAWPAPQRARVDTPVRIFARLRFGADLTEIQVTARVYHAGSEWIVTLHDDGEHGDSGVRDGLYAGVFNPDGVNRPSGNYAVKVRLKSHEGIALDVATLQPGPGTASVQIETFFRLDTGYFAPDEDGTIYHGTVTPTFRQLNQGEFHPRLEVIVRGLPLLDGETHLSLGPKIRILDQQIEFEPPFEEGRIIFSADVLPDAASGARDVAVQVGRSRARNNGGVSVVCSIAPGITPGAVRDLQVMKSPVSGAIDLDWTPALNADDGHSVYEGTLDGRFDSLACAGERVPAGSSSAEIDPSPGHRYYFVRGVNEAAGQCDGYREGPLGLDSRNLPRMAARQPCP